MAKLEYIECSPQTRRNHADKKKVSYGAEEVRSINLTCGRNFYDEVYVYKFKDDEHERDHAYPLTANPDFIFPEADPKDGMIKIFDNWSALTKEQIACTCPFYDIQKGCLKALELGVKRLPKKAVVRSVYKKPVKAEKEKNTRACLYTIKNFKEKFEDSLKDYVNELKNEVENPEEYIDAEVPFLYEAFLFRTAGKPLEVVVPKTTEELEASFTSSVKDFSSSLSEGEQKAQLIQQLIEQREQELLQTVGIPEGMVKPETTRTDANAFPMELTNINKEVENTSLETVPKEEKQPSKNMFGDLDDFEF